MISRLLNGQVFAPEPLGRHVVLVAAGKVVWIGDDPGPIPDILITETVDLEGRRLIPGLIDGHVHLTGGGGEAGFWSRVPRLSLAGITRGGTTTVVGLLGSDDITRSPSDLLAVTRGLEAEGLNAYCLTGGYHVPPVTLTGSVQGDVVHIDRVIGVGEIAVSDHRSSQPTAADLRKIAAQAYVGGMLAGKAGVTHVHVGDGAGGLALVREVLKGSDLPLRALHPTHVNRRRQLFQEALELAAGGSVIDVTAFPVGEGTDAWSALEAVRHFLDAGLPGDRLTISSDAGGSLPIFDEAGRVTAWDIGRPGALGGALADLLAAGLALEQVLPFFTINPARVFGLTGKGCIAPGGDADLVVLDGDGRARDVMIRGTWHIRDRRQLITGAFEGPGQEEA